MAFSFCNQIPSFGIWASAWEIKLGNLSIVCKSVLNLICRTTSKQDVPNLIEMQVGFHVSPAYRELKKHYGQLLA